MPKLKNDLITKKRIIKKLIKKLYMKLEEDFNYRDSFYRMMGSLIQNSAVDENSAICIVRYKNNNYSTEHESFSSFITYKMQQVWFKKRDNKNYEDFLYEVLTYEVNYIFLDVL
jgi:hypothetical protein